MVRVWPQEGKLPISFPKSSNRDKDRCPATKAGKDFDCNRSAGVVIPDYRRLNRFDCRSDLAPGHARNY